MNTNNELHFVVVRNPFDRTERDERFVSFDDAPTIEALVGEYLPAGLDIAASVNGQLVPTEQWSTYELTRNAQLVIVPRIHKGGGGMLSAVLSIALMVVAPAIGAAIASSLGMAGTAFTVFGSAISWGAVFGAGVSLLGSMLIGALTAPEENPQNLGGGASSFDSSPAYAWNPVTTQEPGGPVAKAYGRVKLYGNIIAGRIAESGDNGKDQVAYTLVDLGMGPYSAISDIQLNDQDIDLFSNVTTEIRLGQLDQAIIPDFDDTSTTHVIGARVVKGTPVVRTTTTDTYDALDIVINFPNGLYYSNNSGGLDALTVNATVELSDDDGATWVKPSNGDLTFSAATTKAVRRTIRLSSLTRGTQYQVRVTNLSDDQTSSRYQDDMYLGEINEVMYDDFTYPRSVLVGVKALATDQMSGGFRFSCLADTSLVRVWNGTSWSVEFSRNPAWVCFDILTQPVYNNALEVVRYDGFDPSRLILSDFYAWAQWCDVLVSDGKGGTEARCLFDGIFDTQTNMWSAALDVCASARSTLVLRGTRISVIYDHARTNPAQMFTVGNTSVSSFQETYLPMEDRANSIEVEFSNSDEGYIRDKMTVTDTTAGVDTSKKLAVALRGVVRASQAWREGQNRLAKNKYVQRTAEIGVDIDSLACTVGDLIWVQADVTNWGVGGRATGGTTTSIDLDTPATMESGKVYEIRVRLDDDTLASRIVNNAPGTTSTLTFDEALPSAVTKYVPWAFGEQNRAIKEFLVTYVARSGDQSALLSLIEYNASIYDTDLGTPAIPTANLSSTALFAAVTEVVVEERMYLSNSGTVVVDAVVHYTVEDRSKFRSAELLVIDNQTGAIVGTYSTESPSSFLLRNIVDGRTYDISVGTTNLLGARQPLAQWATTATPIVGKTALPQNVPWFLIDGNTLTWGTVTDIDIDGYVIRWQSGSSTSWGDAVPLHEGVITTSPYPMLSRPSGQVSLLIKAVDTSGNESATPARILVDFGDAIVENVIWTYNYYATGFGGTLTNCTVDGVTGDIIADQAASPAMWSSDLSNMWTADGAAMWVAATYLAMVYQSSPLLIPDSVVGENLTLQYTCAGSAVSVKYQRDGYAPMWDLDVNPMWSADGDAMWETEAFRPWPGSVSAEACYYTFLIEIGAGSVRGEVSAMAARIDVPDISETLSDVVISAVGTRLPILNSYRAITAVNLTLQADGGTAQSVRVEDKDSELGPLVMCLDAGTPTSGMVDAIIQGY